MITTNNGETTIKGSLPEIETDLTIILKHFRKCLSKENIPEDRIDKIIADAVELSKKGSAEVLDMAIDLLMKFLFE